MVAFVVKVAFVLVAAAGQSYDFCTTGIDAPNFCDDGGNASVDVILAQAPLFSTNPVIGDKAGWFGAYHTAIVFAQSNPTGNYSFWTLEYDFTGGSIVKGTVPTINGKNLTWDDEAKYCITPGILWGRTHWSKTFDVVMRISASQARRLFIEFVYPTNTSKTSPRYQLWRVVHDDVKGVDTSPFVRDNSCGDGANWVIHYIATVLGVPPRIGFDFEATSVIVNARAVQRIDMADSHEWDQLVAYYQRMAGAFANVSVFEKIYDLFCSVPVHYIRDANKAIYYKVIGNGFLWIKVKYVSFPLAAPPVWRRSATGVENVAATSSEQQELPVLSVVHV